MIGVAVWERAWRVVEGALLVSLMMRLTMSMGGVQVERFMIRMRGSLIERRFTIPL